jgi:glycerate kinase
MPDGVAIIETAQSNGLSLLPPQLRDPMKTSTAGVGDLVAEALRQGARKIVLALGGSATVDGGSGMAVRLGWRHITPDGEELEGRGCELPLLHRIIPPSRRPRLDVCDAWVDVQTPLLGPHGAVPLFAPQKGAKPEDLPILEQGLARLAECWKSDLDIDASTIPGGGAAGGLGAGARVYLGARLVPGADALFDLIELERRLEWADCLVTGEGRLDQTSFRGKLIGSLFQRASRVGVPVLAVAGQFEDGIEYTAEFRASLAMAVSVSGYCGAESAVNLPHQSLALASSRLMKKWSG